MSWWVWLVAAWLGFSGLFLLAWVTLHGHRDESVQREPYDPRHRAW